MVTLFALGSSLVWGTSDFFAGMASKRRHPVAVVGWTQGLALVALTGLVLWHWGSVTWHGWPLWSVAAGLSGLAGLVCFYTALSTGTMGVVAPIASLGVIVPVTLGVATGDQPSAWAWVGMVIAMVGVTLASGPELSGAVSGRPVLLAVGAAVCFGCTLFSLDRGARSSTLMTLWGMRLTSVSLLLILALVLRTTGGVERREWPELLAIGIGDLCANALFGLASSRGSVSLTSVLGSLYPVVTAGLAWLVLKERMRPVQYVGSVLAIAGAMVIALA
ncbi:MAG: DMT family transporter [Dermatophilaceae bacterium]